MFAKLLKYDFRAIGRIWWILAVSMLGLSTLGGFCIRDLIYKADAIESSTGDGLVGVLEFAALMLLYFAVIAFIIVTAILLLVRYYKNFFTDEGYLTFTLPVSRTKLYLSKLVNEIIWNAATGAVIILSVIIILLIACMPESGEPVLVYFIKEIVPQINSYIALLDISSVWFVIWILEVLVLSFFSTVAFSVIFHLCITVGAIITRKAKVIVGLALYYGVNIVISTASSIISFIFPMWIGAAGVLYSDNLGARPELLVSLGLLLACVVFALMAAALFLINVTCLERKLNLA